MGIGATAASFQQGSTTESEFSELRRINAVSWGAAAIGVGAFVASFVLEPPLVLPGPTPAKTSIGVGPGGVALRGGF
jgi:hypothetical protein